MGFYLPGIGEAIGTIIKANRQEELMAKTKEIMADQTKPWSERTAIAVSMHPELASMPQFVKMSEMGQQAEEQQYQADLRKREVADRTSADQFKALYERTPMALRAALLAKNPDVARRALPAAYEAQVAADKAVADQKTWLERAGISDKMEDENRAQTQAFQAGQNALSREAAAQERAAKMTPQQTADLAVETAARKAEVAASTAEQQLAKKKGASIENALQGLSNLEQDITDVGRVGWSGEDYAKRESMRKSIGLALAQIENPGRAPTDADVAVAMERVPDITLMNGPDAAKAAIKQLKADLGGFKPAGGALSTPPPPPGFKVQR